VTILIGALFGSLIFVTPHLKIAGIYLVFSRTFAVAIIVATMFLTLFISFDLITLFRSKFKGRCLGWLDRNLAIHKFCGHLISIYAIIHSTFHVCGSFPHISGADYEDIQKNDRLKFEFDDTPTYTHLLFGTHTGITGIMLLFVTLTIAVTSFR
jgi:predicted ferric reductase